MSTTTQKKYIRLTKNKVREIFNEANQKYFNNEVNVPEKFELWTPTKRCVAWVRAFSNRNSKMKTHLHISNCYRWTEENLRNTIVHEMIHLHIQDYLIPLTFWQRIFPSLQHNKEFKKEMVWLNKSFPELNIVIKAKHMRKELK